VRGGWDGWMDGSQGRDVSKSVSLDMQVEQTPLISVQHDFDVDLRQADGKSTFWLSIYKFGAEKESIHAKVTALENGQLECNDARVKVSRVNDAAIQVVIAETSVTMRTPKLQWQAFKDGNQINCIACTPSGSLFAAGGNGGRLVCGEPTANGLQNECKGHVGDLTFLKFFPSNKVLLSTATDLTTRIWDSYTGLCGQTLKGHTASVLGAGIVGVGKNVVTCGKDGKILLHHVGSSTVIREIAQFQSAVNAVAVGTSLEKASYEAGDLEFETTDKVVWAVTQGADLTCFNLGGSKLHEAKMDDPLTCVAYSSSKRMVTAGSATGAIYVYQSDSLSRIAAWRTSQAAVSNIIINETNPTTLSVSTADGQCYTCSIHDSHANMLEILVADVDPAIHASNSLTGSRDGKIRQYK